MKMETNKYIKHILKRKQIRLTDVDLSNWMHGSDT
jgi:hypothetical protein